MTEWCSCNKLKEAEAAAETAKGLPKGLHFIDPGNEIVEAWCCPVQVALDIIERSNLKLEINHVFALLKECDECKRTWGGRWDS